MSETNPVGRPRKYKTPEEMLEKATEYFNQFVPKDAEEEVEIRLYGSRPTITGLVLHLGFCDRSAFYKYIEKDEFRHTVKLLRTMIANVYENKLCGANVSGVIFALKNLGWKDKTEVDQRVSYNKLPSVKIDGKEIDFEVG